MTIEKCVLSHTDYRTNITKFNDTVEKLLTLIKRSSNETKLINNYLYDLNSLDYRYITVLNNDALKLSIKHLSEIITPKETILVQNFCKLLVNFMQNNIKLDDNTFVNLKEWTWQALRSSASLAHSDILLALRCILFHEQFNNSDHYLQLLFSDDQLLKKYLNPVITRSTEVQYHAICCLEGILINKSNGFITEKIIYKIKDLAMDVVYSTRNSLYLNKDDACRIKILTSCLHVLHLIVARKLVPISTEFMGKVLGIVQAFLFYGIKEYPLVRPEYLHPAPMNLPEKIHTIPKCKNLKNHKAKSKKQSVKKSTVDPKNNVTLECKGSSICSSDSDASDSESNNSIYTDSKVRLETVRLLQALARNCQSRDLFSFWPQIVATGSQNNARVLARSILKEPVSKVKQHMLCTLTELLENAKPFLTHAEDTRHTSFVTFFGTVCLMIKELHFTLSLILNGNENVTILTHALKCAAALIQGTPYGRLKSGLATKLVRNCRPYIFHKDPTVRVAALSVFEAIAASDPITPEILEILAKQSSLNVEAEININALSCHDTELQEEVDVEDLENNRIGEYDDKFGKGRNISQLVRVCLDNIANKMIGTPVRLQSLKVIGRMAFSAGSLIFPRIEMIATTLSTVVEDSDTQIILHACRTLEIISESSTNFPSNNANITFFWNIIFEPIIHLFQHPQTIIREAACDCLGSINPNIFAQQSRRRTVLIMTVLFSAVHDEESAVRAASLRALGMLVIVPMLREETAFLMDLADVVCLTADDENLGVRIKGAWALANLCDSLSKEKSNEEVELMPLEFFLPKLYRVSIKASKDSDKVKCNGVRALGSILHLCPNKSILGDTTLGLEALINCATLGNDMKVRWNACHALGLVLSNNPDDIFHSSWRDCVFPVLCNLISESANFKVRTNAAWALYSCKSYGKYIPTLWRSIIFAFENSQHVPSYVEYSHRDALVQQLCLTLSHVAACTEISELQNLWIEIGDHVHDVSKYTKQFQENVIPEKASDFIKAKSQLEKYAKSAPSLEDQRVAQALARIFERTNRLDNLDVLVST